MPRTYPDPSPSSLSDLAKVDYEMTRLSARQRSLRAIKYDVAVCARSFDIELTTVPDFIIRFAYGIVQRFLLSPIGG
jgi:hypothetical protein